MERDPVPDGPINGLRSPFIGRRVVIPAKEFDGEVAQEAMNAVNPGLVSTKLHVIVRRVLSEKYRADSIRSGNGLENLVRRAREILRFIRPDEGRADRLWVIEFPALASPLQKVFPRVRK